MGTQEEQPRRRLNLRILAAVALASVSVGASGTTFVAWYKARDALQIAIESRDVIRVQRKLTDYRLCRAINESREINNRDRQTFVRARRITKRDLRTVNDPFLEALLRRSLVTTARELRVRPRLAPLPCVRVVQHPSTDAPPTLTTTTTSTSS